MNNKELGELMIKNKLKNLKSELDKVKSKISNLEIQKQGMEIKIQILSDQLDKYGQKDKKKNVKESSTPTTSDIQIEKSCCAETHFFG